MEPEQAWACPLRPFVNLLHVHHPLLCACVQSTRRRAVFEYTDVWSQVLEDMLSVCLLVMPRRAEEERKQGRFISVTHNQFSPRKLSRSIKILQYGHTICLAVDSLIEGGGGKFFRLLSMQPTDAGPNRLIC